MSTPMIWLGAVMTGCAAWIASPELPWPARMFASLLLGPAPVLFMFQAREADTLPRPLPRVQVYLGSIVALWLLAILSVVAGRASGFEPGILGFSTPSLPVFFVWTGYGVVASGIVIAVFKKFGATESDLMREITPVTDREKAVFVLLSLSAGICEEATFRGFLLPALAIATGNTVAGVALSSLAFGILHAHQKTVGAARAALLGALLAVPVIVTGSIYQSMAAHAIVDIVGGLWLARWLFKSQ